MTNKQDSLAVPGDAQQSALEAAGLHRRRDQLTLIIMVGFAALALLVVLAMLPGYRFNAHVSAADRLLAKKEYAQAIPHLNAIVARYADAYIRHRQLGDAYLATGRPEEALKHYELARKSYERSGQENPDSFLNEEMGLCWKALGEQALAKGDSARAQEADAKALEYFNKVLAEKPDSPAANFYVGLQHLAATHYREAARCFQAAAADEKWDQKAEPYRRQLADLILKAPLPPVDPTPTLKR